MTDQEIIKGLECLKGDKVRCSSCAYYSRGFATCWMTAGQDAIDLINRQQAKIERLKREIPCVSDLGKMYSEIRAEAVREFAEKLKANARKGAWEVKEYIEPDDIDYLVEEMENES